MYFKLFMLNLSSRFKNTSNNKKKSVVSLLNFLQETSSIKGALRGRRQTPR